MKITICIFLVVLLLGIMAIIGAGRRDREISKNMLNIFRREDR